MCWELPETGPPDQLAVTETWRVAPRSQPVDEHWQNLTQLVPGGAEECGPVDPSRVLEPDVVEGRDAIRITVALAVWERGPQIAPSVCPPPSEVQVRLTEPPRAGRSSSAGRRLGMDAQNHVRCGGAHPYPV